MYVYANIYTASAHLNPSNLISVGVFKGGSPTCYLKIWAGISLNKFIQRYKNRLHALISLYQITPLFLGRILTKTNVNSIEISSSGAIFQSSSLKQVITALKSIGLNDVAVAIVKQGAPGMTYQKLSIMLEKLNKGDSVLAVYSMDTSLTQKDVEKLNEIKLKILVV